MKSIILVLSFFVYPAILLANQNFLTSGTYKGFGPTDQSAVAMGEVELVITMDQKAIIRFATGLELEQRQLDLSQFVVVTNEGKPNLDFVAYRPSNAEYPLIVLNHSLPNGIFSAVGSAIRAGVQKALGMPSITIYTGGMGDFMMPIILYSPKQVSAGLYGKAVARVESGRAGALPKVALNGKAGILSNAGVTIDSSINNDCAGKF